MASRALKTDADRDGWVRFILAQSLPLTVSAVKGADRTGAQNRTIAMWYQDAAHETGEDFERVRAQCKVEVGIPILRRDDDEFRAWYDAALRPFPYDTKIEMFIRLQIPVTSIMTVKQATEYMDLVQRRFLSAGIPLRDPEARKYAAEFGE